MKNASYTPDPSMNINGTSYHDVNIDGSLSELTAMFGTPDGGDGGYKTNYEWVLVGDNGDVVTVYDYRGERWHVGGFTPAACVRFADWFRSR